jgi:outer membrane lipoprotein-sorting protein
MSTIPPVPSADDPLDRAVDAIRRAPLPEGPSEQTITRTLAALRLAASQPVIMPQERRRVMFTTLKIAGALIAAAGGLFYFTGFPPAEATVFAEAAQKLQKAQTLSFRMTMKIGGEDTPVTSRIIYKAPALVRSETEPRGGPTSVMDLASGKALFLDPAQKWALLLEGQPAQGGQPRRDSVASMIENMRRLGEKEGEPAGEKVIGDVRARGFRVKEGVEDITVWVDPKSRIPVLIESTGHIGTTAFRSTMADIQLDVDVDNALFSLDPPAGYTLRKAGAQLIMNPEDAVVRVLRAYAEGAGGTFPDRLDNLPAFKKAFSARKAESKSGLYAEAMELATAMARVAVFPYELKDRYGYKADGAKLGDAAKILFWYKPEAQTRYRAVYGDLHVGDVDADQLPEKPKP